ncbi:hypothetical protein GYMLUDRAFT_764010 [Collybiopsis luxurians FD-317 M1]|uniref:GSKIP domain-containing protein n=1 Tax=Collybiopsis luxurians FD-317 M1 TaxID=944289 RepID=A0A0D0CPG2_9AGAR|nr:hypothetical protein GYMLUDRAFT_764010 [Collybiopsis luxurians FD-317 M1]
MEGQVDQEIDAAELLGSPALDPSEFYLNELERALSEQAAAINSFSITSSSSLQATASVTLLEGNTVIIQLTDRGYHLEATQTVFEAIEDLLQSVSPLFSQQKQALLINALTELSSQQNSSDDP